ncbi:hypothetical protein RFI_36134, partial [Reticulomyxa filosa]
KKKKKKKKKKKNDNKYLRAMCTNKSSKEALDAYLESEEDEQIEEESINAWYSSTNMLVELWKERNKEAFELSKKVENDIWADFYLRRKVNKTKTAVNIDSKTYTFQQLEEMQIIQFSGGIHTICFFFFFFFKKKKKKKKKKISFFSKKIKSIWKACKHLHAADIEDIQTDLLRLNLAAYHKINQAWVPFKDIFPERYCSPFINKLSTLLQVRKLLYKFGRKNPCFDRLFLLEACYNNKEMNILLPIEFKGFEMEDVVVDAAQSQVIFSDVKSVLDFPSYFLKVKEYLKEEEEEEEVKEAKEEVGEAKAKKKREKKKRKKEKKEKKKKEKEKQHETELQGRTPTYIEPIIIKQSQAQSQVTQAQQDNHNPVTKKLEDKYDGLKKRFNDWLLKHKRQTLVTETILFLGITLDENVQSDHVFIWNGFMSEGLTSFFDAVIPGMLNCKINHENS